MAQGGSRTKRQHPRGTDTDETAKARRAGPAWTLPAGAVLLAIGLGASGMLAWGHLGGLSLPGCGPGSACARAAASVVPGLDWPVAFLGVAYFAGVLAAWMSTAGVATAGLRAIVRIGALVSVGFLVWMLVGGHICAYCVAAQSVNLVFWAMVERSPRAAGGSGRAVVVATAVFFIGSGALAPVLGAARQRARVRAEAEREASTAAIVAATAERAAEHEAATMGPEPADDARPVTESVGAPAGEPKPARPPFTGRYRAGPELSPIRIVIFTDYQCRDCRRIEGELMQILAQRPEVSLSVKHFPMNKLCNASLPANFNPHPNACWAARAAEAAGMLRGDDGFWAMHRWLFERRGGFTDAELNAGLAELGYEPREFTRVMMGPETLARVRADIDEGNALGLHYTPMIFINGVELKGWTVPNAVGRAVEAVSAQNPPAMSAAGDQPVAAPEKYIADWRDQPARSMPPDTAARTRGGDGGAGTGIEAVVFGDYQEPFTAAVDRAIASLLADRPGMTYRFRPFPFNQECNPGVGSTMNPDACRAAAAAEAAWVVGGDAAYWAMHGWLMTNQRPLSDPALRAAAQGVGLDPDAFMAAMESPSVTAAIAEDTTAGRRLGVQNIPTVFVNGKAVPRWQRDGDDVLQRIVDEAGRQRP